MKGSASEHSRNARVNILGFLCDIYFCGTKYDSVTSVCMWRRVYSSDGLEHGDGSILKGSDDGVLYLEESCCWTLSIIECF
jgi:hypothetical protein